MLYLFQLRCDKEVRLLPIAEQTAALLERALLETDPTSCRRVFCNALRTDPFFAIGVRQAAFQQDELGLTSLTAAVSWLAAICLYLWPQVNLWDRRALQF